MEHLIHNKLSKEQLEELLEGLDDKESKEIYEIYLKTHFNRIISEHLEEPDFQEKIEEPENGAEVISIFRRGQTQSPKFKIFSRVAAVILVLMMSSATLWYILSRNSKMEEVAYGSYQAESPALVEKSTPRGTKDTFTLHDGSVAQLNVDSKLIYPEKFSTDSRKIELIGQAYFQIERDEKRPFAISAKDLTIEVLGTSFDINAYEGQSQIMVTVESGKVKVFNSAMSGGPVYLTKNQKLIYDIPTASYTVADVEANKEMAWRYGVLRFNKTPVAEVERILERWYDIDLVLADSALYTHKITGEHKNESLASVLQALNFALDVRYTVEGNIVTIQKNK